MSLIPCSSDMLSCCPSSVHCGGGVDDCLPQDTVSGRVAGGVRWRPGVCRWQRLWTLCWFISPCFRWQHWAETLKIRHRAFEVLKTCRDGGESNSPPSLFHSSCVIFPAQISTFSGDFFQSHPPLTDSPSLPPCN